MICRKPLSLCIVCLFFMLIGIVHGVDDFSTEFQQAVERVDLKNDICVVLGLPTDARLRAKLYDLISDRDLMVYFQSPNRQDVAKVRTLAAEQDLLGARVFVEEGGWTAIHLADNLAGMVLVSGPAQKQVSERELKRVVYPGGTILLGEREIIKPATRNTDSWSHPYHGPDNNPQSLDQQARAPYLTQFLADPLFSPMPEISVAAGGKVFRAFGHIAHKANQNAMLNTLICVNAYNGRILWQRALKEGFMIHRNTMIATPETLYMADDESCKLIDTNTGKVKDSIVIAPGLADGPVWKWMAMEKGILYALIGGAETVVKTQPSRKPGLGHWPWGMWDGHDYSNPSTNFGFGRTFVAIDLNTNKVLWTYGSEDYLDSRALCMKNGKIYCYCPEKFLACLDTTSHTLAWKTSARDLLDAIGPNERAQHYVTGYATTGYMKCNDDYLFFAGPQRSKLVVASTKDGQLAWTKEGGNLQLVLREDGFYAAGPQNQGRDTGVKYAYDTGEVLARFASRRACTRATGSVDSVFFRTPGGTVRVPTASNEPQHIAPMRPPCQDGVIISDGHLYWGPWMCGCQLSLYGHIALGSAGDFAFRPPLNDTRLEKGAGDISSVARFRVRERDWPTYMGSNERIPRTSINIPESVDSQWTVNATTAQPTAPVVAGGMIFIGDRLGLVQAINAHGQQAWQAHTGGAIYYPPTVARGRAYVGSADGWVYAFEAASGRRLWRFRVGPAARRIPVYGKLISTWPVAGGVVVHKGVVYAAAGIAHYDGTYVVALDAVTGKVKWYNDKSGMLSEKVNSGVSLQGSLAIRNNELQFQGGGVYKMARYDLETGQCLNKPRAVLNSNNATAFYAYFPEYAQYESVERGFPNGNLLRYTASYEGGQHTNLALLGPQPQANRTSVGPSDRRPDRPTDGPRRQPPRKSIWQDHSGTRFKGFVMTDTVLLAAGVKEADKKVTSSLAAIRIRDGKSLWHKELTAPVVKAGLAIDSHKRIIAVLKNGTVMCLQ